MKKIAITGGIGCGKSAVAAMLCEKGLPVLDLDDVTKKVWQDEAIVTSLGERLAERGFLTAPYTRDDIRNAALEAFQNQQVVNVLEVALQPHILKGMQEWLSQKELEGNKAAFVVVPLLFECGLQHLFDHTATINVNNEIRERRLQLSRPLSAHDISQRFNRQWANWVHSAFANTTIENNEGLAELREKVETFLAQVLPKGENNGK